MGVYGADVVAGGAGIAFVWLFLAGALLPAIDSQNSESIDSYVRKGRTQRIANLMIVLSAMAFLVFLGGTALAVLSVGSTGAGWLVVLAAGAVTLGLGLAGTAVLQAQATEAVSGEVKMETVKTLVLLDSLARTMRNLTYVPQALLVGATALAVWQSGVEWMGDIGVLVAVALLAGTAPLWSPSKTAQQLALLALVLAAVWYLLISVALMTGNF